MLELDDIQSGILRGRPSPYAATYIVLRVDNSKDGRELMRRVKDVIASAAHPASPAGDAWLSVALTFQGLKALGVPQSSLDSFPVEFQQGMAARASELGDTGESSPENWERPLGTSDVHIVLAAVAPDEQQLEQLLERGRKSYQHLPGIKAIWRQDCHALPDEREAFGFRDGISHPAVEGSGIPGTNSKEVPLKAGEIILGYPDEMGSIADMPEPEVLGRNGTYAVLRKLHQNVAAFRRFLKVNSNGAEDEELLAAKMMGRWRSGAPLALCPNQDDPDLGADPKRNNDFLYYDDDKVGFKTPPGSHARRMNPRDGIKDSGTSVRIRRMIRRGTSYGPRLPEGVMEDDGADRGLMFLFIGAHIKRQFEFVQSTWLNSGQFIAASGQKDPIAGSNDGAGDYTIPRHPVRRRLEGLPRFVVTRGGEYCFMPGLKALSWLADLTD
jgi:Dyp-type peroxidase family